MIDTLAGLRDDILEWLEESNLTDRATSAINDSIESLWMTLMRTTVSMFVGGPIGLTLSSGTEGVILVSVADPTVAPTAGVATSGSLDAHSVAVKITLVTESGTETLPSPSTTQACLAGEVASITSPSYVSGAIGYNVYGYSTLGPTTTYAKQNDEPVSFGTAYQEPDTGFVNGPELPLVPTENTTGDDICYIKLIEAQMPDLGYKQYDAAAIDSLLMRKAARNIPTGNSQYQNYYWDLINQRQLEFRPALGTSLTPRYFYVKRPRRLRFDNAPLPFLTVPAVPFLKYNSLSLLSISIREFETAKAWAEKAENERGQLELTVMQMNQNKNQYITPYW